MQQQKELREIEDLTPKSKPEAPQPQPEIQTNPPY